MRSRTTAETLVCCVANPCDDVLLIMPPKLIVSDIWRPFRRPLDLGPRAMAASDILSYAGAPRLARRLSARAFAAASFCLSSLAATACSTPSNARANWSGSSDERVI